MAKISLRAYLHEIENLIDRGELDQAQAHCRQILNIYPKNIDTYRLLGKSFLEGQKYREAEDIFQRVLSVIPDDFISHVGLSIVNEEAGKMDGAIWHMERAYEVQPSNIPIMNEVKRLYGRRDGVEPAKVRLTRGALVRMYARTKLIPQAIAEARAALEEDPNRVDLELILAKMYYLSGQKVEASEICTKIITHLPYCLEANRILSEILPETSRAEEAKNLNERVNSLDPYAAYISQNAATSDLVPDNTIMLEHLDSISTGDGFTSTPISSSSKSQFTEPDWFKAISAENSENPPVEPSEAEPFPATPFAIETPESASPSESTPEPSVSSQTQDQMPGWLKDAGWVSSEHVEATPPPLPIDEQGQEQETPAEEAIPADMPDWLKDLQSQSAPITEGQSEINPFAEEQVQETPQIPSTEAFTSEIPDWLGLDKTNEEETIVKPVESLEEVVAEEHIEQPPSLEPSDIPEWLSELKAQTQEETTVVEESHDQPLIEPENQKAEEAPSFIPVEGTVETSFEQSSEKESEPTGETPEVPFVQPIEDESKPTGKAPEVPFVQSVKEESIPADKAPEVPFMQLEEKGLESTGEKSGIPQDWIEDSGIPASGRTGPLIPEPDIPDWLKEIEINPEGEESLKMSTESSVEPVSGEMPDWLKELQEIPQNMEPSEEKSSEAETPPVIENPFEESSTDLQQWLTSLEKEATSEPSSSEKEEVQGTPVEGIPETSPILEDTQPIIEEPKTTPREVLAPEPIPVPQSKTGILEFQKAREMLNANDLDSSLPIFNKIIRSGHMLDDIIKELKNYSLREPSNPFFWQIIGDAYARHSDLREALDSYNKAENLLK